jgi:hypothetical protein
MLLGVSSTGFGQTPGDTPSPLPARPVLSDANSVVLAPVVEPDAAQRAELARWVDEFTDWKQWWAQWRNRRERGWFTSFRDRRQKPAPPDWLAGRCSVMFDGTDPLAPACELLTEWNEDYLAGEFRRAQAAAIFKKEDTSHTIWWEHVHLDLMWPAMQHRSNIFGVAGVHVATSVAGRMQIFIAPGAMLLNMPTRDGGRAWKLATNYGLGFRLFEFDFPGDRRAVLHLNLAKTWILSDTVDVVTGRTMDFAGFSITFKKTP